MFPDNGNHPCAACELAKHLKLAREQLFERLAIAFFLTAVFIELVAFPYGERNDELATEQASKQDFAISMLSKQAQEALGKTKKALDDSNAAISKAGNALGKSRLAEEASRTALTIARGARQEADSFEAKILSAEKSAATARETGGAGKTRAG